MDAQQVLLILVGGLAIALAICIQIIRVLRRQMATLAEAHSQLDSKKRSQSTRYGQISEQFAPFMADWPWDPKQFRFIGTPIDGLQFTEEGVVFVEIKSAASRLTSIQVKIRNHVKEGRVYWHEQRIG